LTLVTSGRSELTLAVEARPRPESAALAKSLLGVRLRDAADGLLLVLVEPDGENCC